MLIPTYLPTYLECLQDWPHTFSLKLTKYYTFIMDLIGCLQLFVTKVYPFWLFHKAVKIKYWKHFVWKPNFLQIFFFNFCNQETPKSEKQICFGINFSLVLQNVKCIQLCNSSMNILKMMLLAGVRVHEYWWTQ